MGILLIVPFLSGCGLVFVNGPDPGWQDASADALVTMAITRPCTARRTLVWVDGVLAAGFLASFFETKSAGNYSVQTGYGPFSGEYNYRSYGYDYELELVTAFSAFLVTAAGAIKGLKKINDCRAFHDRLNEERRRSAQSQATYKWLDDFSPVPDFGVASQNLPAIIPPVLGFSLVFSGSISNSPDQ